MLKNKAVSWSYSSFLLILLLAGCGLVGDSNLTSSESQNPIPDAQVIVIPGNGVTTLPDKVITVGNYLVGIQAGHGNGDPGAKFCSEFNNQTDITNESQLNLSIAEKVKALLEQNTNIQVELFIGEDQAIKSFYGDAFVALHADQGVAGVTGYKVARQGREKSHRIAQ